MPYEVAKPRLERQEVDEDFWNFVRGNLTKFDDVEKWIEVCRGHIKPLIEDSDYIKIAADILPPEPWDDDTWSNWTHAVKVATGRKGRELFMPLRKALTGQDHGPEMKHILLRIGRTKALKRLHGQTA